MTDADTALRFRPARGTDTDAAVPLIFSSGPRAFRYGFSSRTVSAEEFLRRCFADGGGFFGSRWHLVATRGDEVLAAGSFYGRDEYRRMDREFLPQLLRFHPPLAWFGVIRRALRLARLMPGPSAHEHFIANLGVRAEARGSGIGTAMLQLQRERALAAGRSHLSLDVASDNPRAEALYRRLGFVTASTRRFSGPAGQVPDICRLTLEIHGPGAPV